VKALQAKAFESAPPAFAQRAERKTIADHIPIGIGELRPSISLRAGHHEFPRQTRRIAVDPFALPFPVGEGQCGVS
jgi:hypothetical protein